jgi:hypothetical protein
MLQQSYHFEIKDLIASFIDAFDGTVIKRFNQNRNSEKEVKVRYLYVPKQRVLFDILTPGQNLTLPVVSITINSLTRDENRVFNKIAGFYVPQGNSDTRRNALTNYFRTPTPIDIGINMSILTRYQTDMDQILSNFIPFNNPYIILSWQIPSAYNLNYPQEIRSEVLWNGTVNLQYPVEQDPTAKSLIVADTSFTIKGWIFPEETDPVKNIFYINTYISAVSSRALLEYDNYYALKEQAYTLNSPQSAFHNTDVISLSANPKFEGPVLIQVDV